MITPIKLRLLYYVQFGVEDEHLEKNSDFLSEQDLHVELNLIVQQILVESKKCFFNNAEPQNNRIIFVLLATFSLNSTDIPITTVLLLTMVLLNV